MNGTLTMKLLVISAAAAIVYGCGGESAEKTKRVGLKPIEVRDGKAGETDDTDEGNAGLPGAKDSVTAFGLTLHPHLKEYCGVCHSKAQPPLFASEDKKVAHDALVETAKVDFKDIAQSRIVLRVAKENHNCPAGDCEKAAGAFTKGITEWLEAINDDSEVGEQLPRTSALTLGDAVESVIENKNPPGVIYLEAEAGTLKAPMVGMSSATSNRGLYVHTPAGSGNQNTAATALNQNTLGTITFSFNVEQAGSYVLFGRVGAPTANNNGFYVRANNANTLQTWQFPQTNDDFIWDRADAVVAAGTPLTFNLAAGMNTLEIRQRREQARVDALVLAINSTFDPSTASMGDEKVQKLTYDISAQSGVPGAKFSIAVTEYSENAYLFRNPTIETATGVKIKVKNVKLYVNDKFLPQHATYTNIDSEVTGPQAILSTAALVALKDKGDALDQFSFEFEVLEKVP